MIDRSGIKLNGEELKFGRSSMGFFIGNNIFMINLKYSHMWCAFRTSDATQFLTIDASNLKFLQNKGTGNQGILNDVCAIYDKKSRKIFNASLSSLLHLGAKQVNLFKKDLTKTL